MENNIGRYKLVSRIKSLASDYDKTISADETFKKAEL